MDSEGKEVVKFRIRQAEFERPAEDHKSLPPPSLPEIAFVGRSNVGKSTLVNAFCERRALARTSKTPGRTQTFNFYRIAFDVPQGEDSECFQYECYFVDLPGFGYAKVAKFKKELWKEAISQYLLRRQSLEAVVLLIDSRREPAAEERWIVELGKKGNLWVALTKADKLSTTDRRKAQIEISKELRLPPDRVVLVSAEKISAGNPRSLRDTIFAGMSARY